MTTTTHYDLNIVEGTDIVNPLVVDNPNYEKIDEVMYNNALSGVTLATEITNATVHAITRENSECAVIRFIATSAWKAGDTVTVDGVPVTALLPSGETLPDGAYVINANVLCILTGTNLTVYLGSKKVENANEIAFNDTTVGAELVRLDGELVRVGGELVRLDEKIDNVNEIGDVIATPSGNVEIVSFNGVYCGHIATISGALKLTSNKIAFSKLVDLNKLPRKDLNLMFFKEDGTIVGSGYISASQSGMFTYSNISLINENILFSVTYII